MKVYDQREDLHATGGFKSQRQQQKKKMQRFNPMKPKRWSHQDHLDALKGQKIRFRIEGEVLSGTLLEADQFTILVSFDTNPDSHVVYFKSALTDFWKA